MNDIGSFLKVVISATIGVVVVTAIAIPVIGDVTIEDGTANKDAIESMLGLVPLLLVVAIVVGVVAIAINRSR